MGGFGQNRGGAEVAGGKGGENLADAEEADGGGMENGESSNNGSDWWWWGGRGGGEKPLLVSGKESFYCSGALVYIFMLSGYSKNE